MIKYISNQAIAIIAIAAVVFAPSLPGYLDFLPEIGKAEAAAASIDLAAVGATTVAPGATVEIAVSLNVDNQAVTGLESYLDYDSNIFEVVSGSSGSCAGSDFSDTVSGNWAIETCIPDDTNGSQYWHTVSKTVLFSETGYGTINGSQDVYHAFLKVKAGATPGVSTISVNTASPSQSKVFSNGTDIFTTGSSVDFTIDTGVNVAYVNTLAEAAANDGSLDGSVVMTLTGDTFDDPLDLGSDLVVTNAPTSLAAALVRDSATQATLTFTGTADNHADANDVSDLTLTFADSAFASSTAAQVLDATKSDLAIDFNDPVALTYSGSFTEAVANDGTISGTVIATLAQDTFAGSIAMGAQVTATNEPTGLTVAVTRDSDTQLTFSMTGTAAAHADTDDVSNLTLTFDDSAFVASTAAGVTDSTKSDLVVDYTDGAAAAADVTITPSATTVNRGDTVTFTVAINTNTQPVTGVDGYFSYDTAIWEDPATSCITDIVSGNWFAEGCQMADTDSGMTYHTVSKSILFSETGYGTITGATDVYSFPLRVKADATLGATTTLTGSSASPRISKVFSNGTNIINSIGSTPTITVGAAPSLSYVNTLAETVANDGTVGGSVVITLDQDTFDDPLDLGTDLTVTNLPTSLIAGVVRDSDTQATLTFTGTADSHDNADNVSNLTLTFADSAFAASTAAQVTDATKSDLTITFLEPTLTYGGTTLNENAANDGSVTETLTVTLANETFAVPAAAMTLNTHYTVANEPAGLTTVVTGTSGTTATIGFTGNATNHGIPDDVSNFAVTFLDAAFDTYSAAAVTNAATPPSITIDFFDTGSIAWSGSFAEAIANDGSVTGSIVGTLTNDTFVDPLTSGIHYDLTNLPSSLAGVLTRDSATQVTLTLTGNADNHEDANDVSDLTLTFNNGAFVTEATASLIGNNPLNNGAIDFNDNTDASIVYDVATFTEAAVNDGSTTTTITATLTNDTFNVPGGAMSATEFVPVNLPAGFTAMAVTGTSTTTATIQLTGSATAHENANDISNLQIGWQDAAFATNNAADVAGYDDNFTIDYTDAPVITYDTSTFAESTANDGNITTTVNFTLVGDTFNITGAQTGTEVAVNNIPAGFTGATVTTSSNTAGTITLDGQATAHEVADNIANLEVAWTDAAFAGSVASANITNGTKSDFDISYIDAPTLTYLSGAFNEVAVNDGTIDATTPETIILAGDTFAQTVGNLTEGVHYNVTNLPAGHTLTITANSNTQLTATISGTADNHEVSDSIANLQITFLDILFDNVAAANITNADKSDLAVNYTNAASIAYSGTGFTENANNDSQVTGSIIATLTGDTFVVTSSNLTEGVHYNLGGVPTGMTATLAVDVGGNIATLTLGGSASSATNADDVANITFDFLDGAFNTTATAANVINATGPASSSLGVDFIDVALSFDTTTFAENVADDGTIGNDIVVTLSGGLFAVSMTEDVELTFNNEPTGLDATFTRDSDTQLTVSLTGTAANHANADDIANFEMVFADSAFQNGVTAAVVTDSTKSDFVVDYTEGQEISYSTSTFTEAAANDGTIDNTTPIVATLSGDTFTITAADMTENTHYLVFNEPSGLTIKVTGTSTTTADITLTGTAAAHANADDIANLQILFLNAAFTGNDSSVIANSNKADYAVDFADTPNVSYDVTAFVESASNVGAVSTTSTATLLGDTFVVSSGAMTNPTHFTTANVPSGLTLDITATSTTTATISLSGSASPHTSSENVANMTITFVDGAFTGGSAAAITDATKADFSVTFDNAAVIAYTGTGFTETAANDGAVSGSIIATVTGDTLYDDDDNDDILDIGTEVILANVPTGLTPAIALTSGDTVATLTLSGNASAHADTDDVADITWDFQDIAFSNNTDADNVVNATGPASSSLGVNFKDVSLAYTNGGFTEAAANDGTVAASDTVTLAGDTWDFAIGTILTSGVHYTPVNVPSGFTEKLTVASSTTMTVALSGSADNHESTDDIANLGFTFLDGVFTDTATAANVTDYNKGDLTISYTDAPTLVYTTGGFTEAVANDGSIAATDTVTLAGDTFVLTSASLVKDTHYSIANLPTGLTEDIAIDATGLIATVTLNGNATAHANADDVSNLSITFLDGAFTNTTAAADVTGYANTSLTIDFSDVALTYSGTTFTEAAANDGSIGNTQTITLAGDTFAVTSASLTDTTHYTIANLPSSLTADIAIDAGGTVATVTLNGTADSHANTDDVANLGITFTDAAFTNSVAASISDYNRSDLTIDFSDVTLTYSGTTFTEAAANDGSIGNTQTITLAGDTFAVTSASLTDTTHYTIANLPSSLTADIAIDAGGTVATVTLNGTADSHANTDDVANLDITFLDAAFTNSAAANVGGFSNSALSLDFSDVTITYGSSTFSEGVANDGSISNTVSASLSGDTFVVSSGSLTAVTHYNITNLPSSLTADISVDAGATNFIVTLSGTADSHLDTDDVSDLTIAFTDAAFTNSAAANVTDASKADFVIDFSDPTGGGGATMTYDATTFTENALNDGTISTTITATLASDTFVTSGGAMTLGTDYTVTNLPAGLTLVITGTSTTTATITISGTAAAHAAADSISNLAIAFLPAAFTTGISAAGASQTYNLTFVDVAGAITWASSAFTEHGNNDGSIGNTITAALSGDTFAVTNGNLTDTTHYTVSNLPAGFTAATDVVLNVDASGTNLIVTINGNATAHESSDDIANLGITFTDAAFTSATAAQITDSAKADFTISYTDEVPATSIKMGVSATTFGDETGPVDAVFTISIDNPAPAGGLTFDLTLDDTGDADTTAGTDYTDNSATGITIAAGATSATHTVTVLDDGDDDNGNHTFTATISNATAGVTIDQATATATIIDNDPVIASTDTDTDNILDNEEDTSFNNEDDVNGDGTPDKLQPLVASIDDGTNSMGIDFGIEVDGACSAIQALSANAEASNASSDPNYAYDPQGGFQGFQVLGCPTGGTITMTAYFGGVSSVEGLQLFKFDGTNYFTVESVTPVTMEVVSIGGVDTAKVTYDVIDNGPLDTNTNAGEIFDPIGLGSAEVNFATSSQTVAESAGAVTVTASIAAATFAHITATYTLSGTASSSGVDYTDTTSGTISIPAGQTSGTATITINDDTTASEGTETAILTLTSVTNGSVGTTIPTHTISITENDITAIQNNTGGGGGGGGGGSSRLLPTSIISIGNIIAVTYPREMDPEYVPAASQFTVMVGGTAKPVGVVLAANKSLLLLLGDRILPNESVSVSYKRKSRTGRPIDSSRSASSYKNLTTQNQTSSTVAAATPATCTAIYNTDLREGDRNENVRAMQQFLAAQGFDPGVADGWFGSKTRTAVSAFQARHAATILAPNGFSAPTGIWASNTRAQANKIKCGTTTPVAAPALSASVVAAAPAAPAACGGFATRLEAGDRGVEVSKMQQFLIRDGQTIPAGATGFFGGQTVAAVNAFQSKYNDILLAPNAITTPTGVFGPASQRVANGLSCGTISPRG